MSSEFRPPTDSTEDPAGELGQVAPQAEFVLFIKEFARAKSRLRVPSAIRPELAAAMCEDTVRALTPLAQRLILVSEEPAIGSIVADAGLAGEVEVVGDSGNLNASARHVDQLLGATTSVRFFMVADLPALQTPELVRILAAAVDPHCFVPDASGTGTTMVISRGAMIPSHFGPGSAAAHQRGGWTPVIGPWPGARHDVDTREDLTLLATMACGPRTAAMLAALPGSAIST